MSNSLAGKKILIFQQRNWGTRIGHFLAKKLRSEGCRLAALTFKKTTHAFTLKQREVKYDLIINDDEVAEDPQKYLGADDYSLAEIEEELGIDSLWALVGSMRQYGRSYQDKYYYSFRQNMSDEEIASYIKAVYKYTRIFFDKFQPDLIVTPAFGGDLRYVMFNHMADKRGVKMIGITDSKVQNILIFAHDYLNSRGLFYDRVKELNGGKIDSENRDKARKYIAEFRQRFKRPGYMDHLYRPISIMKKIKREIFPFYEIWKWYRNPQKTGVERLGITSDNRPPSIILRDHYTGKKYQKAIDNFSYYPLGKIKKYAYFPLQFQPETPIDLLAPFFSNQIETARQIAMSLPGDYTLVVKEHPAMAGRRSPSYYEKLSRTPNVKLVDYRTRSDSILKSADLIVSPGATTIAEAVLYGKPVIQLGNYGTTKLLPGVFPHSDMANLNKKIREILKAGVNTELREKQLENFVSAAFDTGFDFEYLEVWHRGKKTDLEVLWDLYRKEIERILK